MFTKISDPSETFTCRMEEKLPENPEAGFDWRA